MIEDDSPVVLAGDSVRVGLLPLGATLHHFDVRLPDGGWRNIMLGSDRVADYRGTHAYVGSTLGRFANRIAGARFSLAGVEYRLDANEPPNQLHGGRDGFHVRTWTIEGSGRDWVEFGLVSPDGDQGFPGELRASARFELVPGGAQVTYRATTDAPTVVNLTTHPYVNLEGEGAGDTDGHLLVVHASAWTPTGPDGVPTGEVRDVTGTAADFRSGRRFGEARRAAAAEGITRNDGFDHNFVVDGSGLREHCRVTAGGITLAVESDQPALQVYGGEHFDGSFGGPSGRPYARRAGIALETQHFPDSPHHPGFPSTVLRPGEVFTTTTRWLVEA